MEKGCKKAVKPKEYPRASKVISIRGFLHVRSMSWSPYPTIFGLEIPPQRDVSHRIVPIGAEGSFPISQKDFESSLEQDSVLHIPGEGGADEGIQRIKLDIGEQLGGEPIVEICVLYPEGDCVACFIAHLALVDHTYGVVVDVGEDVLSRHLHPPEAPVQSCQGLQLMVVFNRDRNGGKCPCHHGEGLVQVGGCLTSEDCISNGRVETPSNHCVTALCLVDRRTRCHRLDVGFIVPCVSTHHFPADPWTEITDLAEDLAVFECG